MKVDAKTLSPLVWAYIGDAVYELHVRKKLAQHYPRIKELHQHVVHFVRAETQAAILGELGDRLTEEEKDIVRRGRNTKSAIPRQLEVAVYRQSTGFEALIGFLHLSGREDRLQEILAMVPLEIDR